MTNDKAPASSLVEDLRELCHDEHGPHSAVTCGYEKANAEIQRQAERIEELEKEVASYESEVDSERRRAEKAEAELKQAAVTVKEWEHTVAVALCSVTELAAERDAAQAALDVHHASEVPLHNRKQYDLTGTIENPERIRCRCCGQDTISRTFPNGESDEPCSAATPEPGGCVLPVGHSGKHRNPERRE